MISDLHTAKFTRLFEALDAGADDLLRWEDVHALASSLCSTHTIQPFGLHGRRLEHAVERLWSAIERMVDGEGDQNLVVSLPRWLEATRHPRFVHDVGRAAADVFFTAADADGDGRVNEAEWIAGAATLGVSSDRAQANFKEFDGDGDGYVSRDEAAAAAEAFLLSTNPEITGVVVGRP